MCMYIKFNCQEWNRYRAMKLCCDLTKTCVNVNSHKIYTYNYIYIYCTVKNICGEKTLENLANYSISPSFFTNVYNFHSISNANGLQFAKVFPAKLPTVLIHQSFLLYSIQQESDLYTIIPTVHSYS